MRTSVSSNIKKVSTNLKDIQKKQIPFATSKAINETIFEVRASTKLYAAKIFKRTTWMSPRSEVGMRVVKSHKRQANINAKLGFDEKNRWIHLHVDGGVKRPKKKYIAIPTEKVPKKYKKVGGVSAILTKEKHFANKWGVFKRTGKGKKGKITKLFTFAKRAKIKKVFFFYKNAKSVIKTNFNKNFKAALQKAISTAK
jgi:hypothetical protein